MQTSENPPSTSSVHRGDPRGFSTFKLPQRFFLDPQLLTVLIAHRSLKRSAPNVVPTRSKPRASTSQIEAALRLSISATLKRRVI